MQRPANRGILVFSIVLLSIVLISCAGGVGTGGSYGGATGRTTEEKRVYLRDTFRHLVYMKSQEEVLKAVGKPDTTQETGGMVIWYYKGITKDPITEKIDYHVQLVFESGKVLRVNY